MTTDATRSIGIFGGSFDPPHLGHVLACLWALETADIGSILVVPVGSHPWGKQPHAPYEHRLAMCRLAMARLSPAVLVSDIEGQRTGTTYMIDTIEQLTTENPGVRYRLLVGSDVAPDVRRWRSGPRLLELAPPIELPRPTKGDPPGGRAGTLPDISSTVVRRALHTRRGVGSLLPRAVIDYIDRHGLYTHLSSTIPTEIDS